MAEFNGDLNSSGYVGGVNWTGVNRFMTATADAPEDQGSYLGEADKFNDRRLVADANGAAVMAIDLSSNTLQFATPDDEFNIRIGFEHPNTFFMAPDVWYMAGDFTNGGGYENGINWGGDFITALGDNVDGNFSGRSEVLVGKTFRAANGVEMTIVSASNPETVVFETTADEATFRAGFEHPNMWRELVANGNTLNDCRFTALRDQGFTGQTNDMLLQWLQDNGATSDCLPDAWLEMLIAQGATPAHRNDMWYE